MLTLMFDENRLKWAPGIQEGEGGGGGGGRIPSNFQLSFIMENCRGFFTAGNYVWGEGEEIALIKIINSNFTSK